MDLTAKARARAVCLLSTSVQSLQVAGFGFILLTGQLHTPFLLLFLGLPTLRLPKLQECLHRQEVRPALFWAGSSLLLPFFPSQASSCGCFPSCLSCLYWNSPRASACPSFPGCQSPTKADRPTLEIQALSPKPHHPWDTSHQQVLP